VAEAAAGHGATAKGIGEETRMGEEERPPANRERRCSVCGAELVVRKLQSGSTIACDAQPASVVNRAGLLVIGHRPHSEVCALRKLSGRTRHKGQDAGGEGGEAP
jgi:hypothetical protein